MSDFSAEPGLADLDFSVRLLSSTDPVVIYNIANDLAALGAGAAAAIFYEEAIRRGVDDAYLNLGYLYEDLGEAASALRMFTEAYRRGSVEGAFSAGQLLEAGGRLSEAQAWYERAATMPEAPPRLARVLRAQGALDDAWKVTCDSRLASWESAVDYALDHRVSAAEAIALLEDHAKAGSHEVAVTLADLYEREGRLAEAEQLLRTAAERGDLHAATNLGVLLHDSGREAEGNALWKRSAESGDELAGRLLRERSAP